MDRSDGGEPEKLEMSISVGNEVACEMADASYRVSLYALRCSAKEV